MYVVSSIFIKYARLAFKKEPYLILFVIVLRVNPFSTFNTINSFCYISVFFVIFCLASWVVNFNLSLHTVRCVMS